MKLLFWIVTLVLFTLTLFETRNPLASFGHLKKNLKQITRVITKNNPNYLGT